MYFGHLRNLVSALTEILLTSDRRQGSLLGDMVKGRTGAANGRTGGKLGGGIRARNTLKALPRVKIVGAIAQSSGGSTRALLSPASPPGTVGVAAASRAIMMMGQALELTPTRMGLAQQVAVAAVAAQQAASSSFSAPPSVPAAQPRGNAGKHTLALVTPASSKPVAKRPAACRAPDSVPTTGLAAGKRGTMVVVQPKSSYGANKTFFWADVVAVGQLIKEVCESRAKVARPSKQWMTCL